MAPGYSIHIVRGMPATSRANNERNQPPVFPIIALARTGRLADILAA
jgi:hypothetical protein